MPSQGSPAAGAAALPPQDRPAGAPRPGVTAPARRKCPAFGRFKSGRTAPVRKMGTRRGGCTPSRPRSLHPSFPPPLSLRRPTLRTSPLSPRRLPAPLAARRAHLGPRWWRWSSRSPSRRWPGTRRCKLAAAGLGGGDGGGGRCAPSGRPAEGTRGQGTSGGRPLPPLMGAGQGAAGRGKPGRKSRGTPIPHPALGPRRAHPSPRQPRLRPIHSLLWAPRPSIGRC